MNEVVVLPCQMAPGVLKYSADLSKKTKLNGWNTLVSMQSFETPSNDFGAPYYKEYLQLWDAFLTGIGSLSEENEIGMGWIVRNETGLNG